MLKTGKTENSYRKHELIARVVRGQAHAWRSKHYGYRMVIVDTNAGDGNGVPLPQTDFFVRLTSQTTADISMSVADEVGDCDVILCEKGKQKIERLQALYRTAYILDDHESLMQVDFSRYDYAIIINDPNGPASNGLGVMKHLAQRLPSDFVIVHNQSAVERIMSVKDRYCGQDKYGWMNNYPLWRSVLQRQFVAKSALMKPSRNFCYRILVVANVLASFAKTQGWSVIQ